MTLERKQETRRKIELGGLVIKAGLYNLQPTVILGILLDAALKISSVDGEHVIEQYKKIGAEAFEKMAKN